MFTRRGESMRVIAGSARGKKINTIKGDKTRPTADRVKESLFNILRARVEGADFLDVFAGSGSVGIEALSRGAKKVVFIEKNGQCVKIIKDNLLSCQFRQKTEIWQKDALTALDLLARAGSAFDLVFLDPPYHDIVLNGALEKIAAGRLLAAGGLVIVEHHRLDRDWIDDALWQLIREKEYGDTVLSFLIPRKKAKEVK